MTNLDVANMKEGEFSSIYEKVKAVEYNEKKPINSSNVSLGDQLTNFKTSSFSAQDNHALYEDLLSM